MYNLDSIQHPEVLASDLDDVSPYAIKNFITERAYQRELSQTGNCWEQLVKAYLACASFTDDRIGLILDALDKSPYADNTLIVLLGDNGYHHGEKERWGKSALWRQDMSRAIHDHSSQGRYPICKRYLHVGGEPD